MRPFYFPLLGIVLAGVSLAENTTTGTPLQESESNAFLTFNNSDFIGVLGSDVSILYNPGETDHFEFTTVNVTDTNIEDVILMDGTRNETISSSIKPVNETTITVDFDTAKWTIGLDKPGNIFDKQSNGNVLYFEVAWNTSEDKGKSYSRNFTYINQGGQTVNWDLFTSEMPYSTETYTSLNSASPSPSSSTPASSASATKAGSTTLSSSSGSSGKGGLKAGAIAGIVVGVVVGLAIIGGLAWFCLRRRQRNKNGYNKSPQLARSVEPYGGLEGISNSGRYESVSRGGVGPGMGLRSAATEGLIREKEERAATVATSMTDRDGESNSPYTDDFSSVTAVTAPVAPAPAATSDAPFAPVAPVAPVASGTSGTSGASAGSDGVSTPVISGQVAALIEDGMTPEDVARLAAEEMELDAAIQHARHARTDGAQP